MTKQDIETKIQDLRNKWKCETDLNRRWIIEQQGRLLKMALGRVEKNEPDINRLAEKLFGGKI